MNSYRLTPHRYCPSVAVTAITVSIARSGDMLSLRYAVEGELDRVLWPEPETPARTGDLWMHSCFEAFIQAAGEEGYIELNLSPSGRWASYAFDGHREGMRDAAAAPDLDWARPVMTAGVALDELAGKNWRIGLTTVVEAVDGSKSFWGLGHKPNSLTPDFHNADCFSALLPAPERP